jgi:D-tyrosyl-tRNA(Tyr) deacylase
MILIGTEADDTEEDIKWLVKKISGLRIFNDDNGVMNLSIKDMGYDILAISQFTLYASTKKGNRPSYLRAAKPDIAIPLYESFISHLTEVMLPSEVKTGIFGADMKVSLLNDGPVTIFIDSKNKE